MNKTVKNILAVIAGIVVGSVVTMAITMLSGSVIPPPAGVDPSNMESIKASMHLFETKHFVSPFLAHALGAFTGALLAAVVAVSHKQKFALAVGVFFLLGGIASAFMLPAPTWYIITDLVFAYIPMAYLGGMVGAGFNR
jgi:hypothetical protein